jgi:murein endopeptidase
VSLLCAVAALVPLAAMGGDGDESPVASAAPGALGFPAGTSVAARRDAARNLAEEPVGTPAIEWRDSTAVGTPNSGRLVNGVLLPALGEGFYTYNPATQTTPGGSDRQWGTASLVREILEMGRWWARRHPNQPRLGIGDLSRPEGGNFPGPGVGHASHQNGLDVDIRLPRRDGVEGPATAANYDRALTQELVDRLVAQGAELILVGPSLDLSGPPGIVVEWPNHDDHLHVRFSDD